MNQTPERLGDRACLMKLSEECSELIQIAMKKAVYLHTDDHPDNDGPMSDRIENEMGDVLAAIQMVSFYLNLDWEIILQRMEKKLQVYLSFNHGGKPEDFDMDVWQVMMPFVNLKVKNRLTAVTDEQVENITQMQTEWKTTNQ